MVDADGPGYAVAFPCGSPVPLASNVNFATGGTVASLVVAQVGDGGQVCVYTSNGADLVIDIDGYFAKTTIDSTFSTVTPARLVDTRIGGATVDGASAGRGRLKAGDGIQLSINGRGGVSDGASSVVINITAVKAGAPGFLSVWPCNSVNPHTSTLNFAPGETVANAVFVGTGPGDVLCIRTSAATDLIVDVSGYYEERFFSLGAFPE